uniref:RNA-dependent RNA polymerase n=1 Tax=Heterobasidion partitivirus 23 TaxID=3075974 RepID=A0AA95Z490_9VIRU|nr:RNA-dependent RNA polymerase [Heterobasidion partitivirus 23]
MQSSIPPFLSDFFWPRHESKQSHELYSELLERYRLDPSIENLHSIQEHVKNNGFTYYVPVGDEPLPDNRQPASGIHAISGFRFQLNNKFHAFSRLSRYGYAPLGYITYLLSTFFMTFLHILDSYCRPSGSADAIFDNFNQNVTPVDDPEPSRLSEIMSLIHHFMAIIPFSPIAFPDLRFYKWTLTTASDYHARNSQNMQRGSQLYWQHLRDNDLLEERFDYSERPQSKGFFYNVFLIIARTMIHYIKYTGLPFDNDVINPVTDYHEKLFYWFMRYPTQLFVRSQISPLDKLKVRPVYNAPMLFLFLEAMLTLPLMAMCRLPENCMLWGFETIRGGMAELNRISSGFTTFIMIDWSRFDQLAPFAIIYHFWCTFLPSLLRVDRGWMPTQQYRTYLHKQAFTDKHFNHEKTNPRYQKYLRSLHVTYAPHILMFSFVIFNLCSFIWLWYCRMVFITPDGIGYVRLLAGVPSGIFMTQILDSFVNLFLFIDALLEFGFSPDEIRLIRLFIQGDDNIAFFVGDFERIFAFYEWLPDYALTRWHMIISIDKSSITRLRNKIEVLGYRNNNGMPSRDPAKLVATLAYPERIPAGSQMYLILMMRAIGLAYANAGHSSEFHSMCQRSYNDARVKSGLTLPELTQVKIDYRKLGFFEIFSTTMAELNDIVVTDLSRFPDFYDIRANLYNWHGPHTVYPMWPRHFNDTLSSVQDPTECITLLDIMQQNGLKIDKNF